MRIIIRLKSGKPLRRHPHRRACRQLAVWCGQIAAFGYLMTLWKYGYDLQATERFVFDQGWLSHWQSWGAVSLAAQWATFRLRRAAETPTPAAKLIPMPSSSSASRHPSRSAPSTLYRAG
jgi:hypothetical protein